ncbi:MAG: hypothetical protein HEEMFOPI_00354 [Holosporales bacterium]
MVFKLWRITVTYFLKILIHEKKRKKLKAMLRTSSLAFLTFFSNLHATEMTTPGDAAPPLQTTCISGEDVSSAIDRWGESSHDSLDVFEKTIVFPTLCGLERCKNLFGADYDKFVNLFGHRNGGKLDTPNKANLFDSVFSFVGASRRLLAAATEDEHTNVFGIQRDGNSMPYTPVGGYPLMKKRLEETCLNHANFFITDGAWHPLSADLNYRLNYQSVASWFEWCSISSQTDTLESREEKKQYFLKLRMILNGDKDSFGGPAGVILEPMGKQQGKMAYQPNLKLVELLRDDSLAYEKSCDAIQYTASTQEFLTKALETKNDDDVKQFIISLKRLMISIKEALSFMHNLEPEFRDHVELCLKNAEDAMENVHYASVQEFSDTLEKTEQSLLEALLLTTPLDQKSQGHDLESYPSETEEFLLPGISKPLQKIHQHLYQARLIVQNHNDSLKTSALSVDELLSSFQNVNNRLSNIAQKLYAHSCSNQRVKVGCLDLKWRGFDSPWAGQGHDTRQIYWIKDETGQSDDMVITLMHPSGPAVQMHKLMAKSYFNQALSLPEDADQEEKLAALVRFSYVFSLGMPFPRGSALCNEWMTIGLYIYLSLPIPEYREEEQWSRDIKAWRDSFKKWDEYAQSSVTFEEYLSLVMPGATRKHPGLFETVEVQNTRVITTQMPKWLDDIEKLKIGIYPVISRQTPLCRLMVDAGSDKNSIRHTYTQLYFHLLKDKVDQVKNVLEIGIGSTNPRFGFTMGKFGVVGASLRAYREFFENAQIFGADIDRESLFTEDRIRCVYMNSLEMETIKQAYKEIGEDVALDLIIDDGYHDFIANKNGLIVGLPHLTSDGLYIVEDVRTDQILLFIELLKNMPNYEWAIVQLPAFENPYDNNVVLVRKKNTQPDYVI